MTWWQNARKNLFFQSFILTFLLFAISYLTVGWWNDAYQHMFDTAISGQFTDYYLPSGYNPFPEYMSGAAFIFNRLGHIYPIQWNAFFLNGILFVSIWLLFRQLLRYSFGFPLVSRLFLLAFFSLLFFESVVLYHMVRVTMFAGIAAMSFLIVNDENKLLSKRALPYLLLFILALWIRSNVHLFILIFVTAVFILHKKPLKPLIPFWASFVVFFLIYCKIVFWTDHTHDLNSYFLYNTEFKLYHVGQFTPNLKLTEPLDSVKYAAIRHDILGDEQNLTPDFYQRINIFSNLNKFSFSQVMYAWYTFLWAISQNVHFIVADLLLIFCYILLGGNLLKNYRLKTFGLFIFFYMVVFGICFIKMENRFLVPFQVLFLFTIISLHKPKLFSEKKNIYYLIGFSLIVFPLSARYINMKLDFSKDETYKFKESYEYLKQNYSDHIMVINTGFVTQNRPYETFYQKDYFKKFYFYNYYACQLGKWYRPYIEKECNCDAGKFYTFYDYLQQRKEPVLLANQADKMDVLQQYLAQVHHKDYHFSLATHQGPERDSIGFRIKGFTGPMKLYEMGKP